MLDILEFLEGENRRKTLPPGTIDMSTVPIRPVPQPKPTLSPADLAQGFREAEKVSPADRMGLFRMQEAMSRDTQPLAISLADVAKGFRQAEATSLPPPRPDAWETAHPLQYKSTTPDDDDAGWAKAQREKHEKFKGEVSLTVDKTKRLLGAIPRGLSKSVGIHYLAKAYPELPPDAVKRMTPEQIDFHKKSIEFVTKEPEGGAEQIGEIAGSLLPYIALSPVAGALGTMTEGILVKHAPRLASTALGKLLPNIIGRAAVGAGISTTRETSMGIAAPDEFELKEALVSIGADAAAHATFAAASKLAGEPAAKAISKGLTSAFKAGHVGPGLYATLTSLGKGTATGATMAALDTAVAYLRNPEDFDAAVAAQDAITTTLFFAGLEIIYSLDNIIGGSRSYRQGHWARTDVTSSVSNPYAELGLKPGASLSEVKSAYRSLSKKYHPDLTSGQEEKFKRVAVAYAKILHDMGPQAVTKQEATGAQPRETATVKGLLPTHSAVPSATTTPSKDVAVPEAPPKKEVATATKVDVGDTVRSLTGANKGQRHTVLRVTGDRVIVRNDKTGNTARFKTENVELLDETTSSGIIEVGGDEHGQKQSIEKLGSDAGKTREVDPKRKAEIDQGMWAVRTRGRGSGGEPQVEVTKHTRKVHVLQKGVPVHEVDSADLFKKSVDAARENNPLKLFLSEKESGEYKDHKLFLLPDSSGGVAVSKAGNIVSVFRNPHTAKKGQPVLPGLMLNAIKQGGTHLDCYGVSGKKVHDLPARYAQYGFVPVARMKWNDTFAPEGWDYDKHGRPDIIFMRHNGDTVETIKKKHGEYPDIDMNKVPYVEEWDDGVKAQTGAIETVSMVDRVNAEFPDASDASKNTLLNLLSGKRVYNKDIQAMLDDVAETGVSRKALKNILPADTKTLKDVRDALREHGSNVFGEGKETLPQKIKTQPDVETKTADVKEKLQEAVDIEEKPQKTVDRKEITTPHQRLNKQLATAQKNLEIAEGHDIEAFDKLYDKMVDGLIKAGYRVKDDTVSGSPVITVTGGKLKKPLTYKSPKDLLVKQFTAQINKLKKEGAVIEAYTGKEVPRDKGQGKVEDVQRVEEESGISKSSQKALDKGLKDLGKNLGREVEGRIVTKLTREQRDAADKVYELTGMETVFYTSDSDFKESGMSVGNKVLINADTKVAPMFIAGHEIGHALSNAKETQSAFQAMLKEVGDISKAQIDSYVSTLEGTDAYRQEIAKDKNRIKAEMVSDVVGNIINDMFGDGTEYETHLNPRQEKAVTSRLFDMLCSIDEGRTDFLMRRMTVRLGGELRKLGYTNREEAQMALEARAMGKQNWINTFDQIDKKVLRKYVKNVTNPSVAYDQLVTKGLKNLSDAEFATLSADMKQTNWPKKFTEEQRKDILKEINYMKRVVSSKKYGKDFWKMDPIYRNEILELLHNLDWQVSYRTRKKIRGLANTLAFLNENIDDVRLPDHVMQDLKLLDKAHINYARNMPSLIRDLTYDEVMSIFTGIRHAIKLNSLKNKLKVGRRLRDEAEVVREAVGNVNPQSIAEEDRLAVKHVDATRPHVEPGMLKKFLGVLSKMPEFIAETLDGKEGGVIHSILYDGIDQGYTDMLRVRNEGIWAINDAVTKELGKLKNVLPYSRYFNRKAKDVDIIKVTLPKDRLIGREKDLSIDLTKAQRMSLYLHSICEENLASMIDGGIRFDAKPEEKIRISMSDLSILLSEMTAEEKEIADAMFKHLNTTVRDAVNKTSLSLYGYELAKVTNYWTIPRLLDEVKPVGDILTSMKHFDHRAIEHLSFTKERQKVTKSAVLINDAFAQYYSYLGDASAFVGFAEPIRNARALMKNDQFKSALYKKGLKHYHDALNKYLNDVEGNISSPGQLDRLAFEWLNKIQVSILGLNPWIMLKQPVSYLAAGTEIESRYLLRALKDAHNISIEKFVEELRKYSPQLIYRNEGHTHREMGELGEVGVLRRLFAGEGFMLDKFTAGIQKFDQITISALWEAVKMEQRDLHPNLKGDAFMEKVARRAEQIVNRTQPSYLPHTRSEIGRTPSVFWRVWTTFTTQTNKNYNLLLRAAERFMRSPKKAKDWNKFCMDIFLVAIASSMVIASIDEMRDIVYKRKRPYAEGDNVMLKRAVRLLEYNMNYVYGASDVYQSWQSKREMGSFFGYDLNNPLYNTLNDAVNALSSIASIVDEFGEEHKIGAKKGEPKWPQLVSRAIDDTLHVTSRFAGVPYHTVKRLAESIAIHAIPDGKFYVESITRNPQAQDYYEELWDYVEAGRDKDAERVMRLLVSKFKITGKGLYNSARRRQISRDNYTKANKLLLRARKKK